MPQYNIKEIQKKLLRGIMDGTYDSILEEINSGEYSVLDSDFKIPLVFVNKSDNQDPSYAKEGDSGFDIRANLTESIRLEPFKRALIPTGLYFDLPEGFELQVRSRSGLALNNGVFVLNSPGTIDEMYTGECGIILMNLSDDVFIVHHGDRIAQGVLANVSGQRIVKLTKTDEITKTSDRGAGGFGHTGRQ